MLHALFFSLLVSTFFPNIAAFYHLANDYSGTSFFEGWDFFTEADPTHGHVLYQSQVNAKSQGLIKFQDSSKTNAAKQVFIGVDSQNKSPQGRPAVRITTQKTFHHALVLADIAHAPGGICGVWPAFWMVGANWPTSGEIDIFEGVSTQSANQMTLHTNAGPIIDRNSGFTGDLLTANCDVKAPNQPANVGCGIADKSDMTFGKKFNTIGGGVYATEWTSEFIKIWFFPRDKIPADIQQGNPVPSSAWGTPNSQFRGAFQMDEHFKDLSIVMNTAFCGDWAGNVWTQTPECAKLAPTCDDYVTNNPSAFEQAFWLVNSVKVFQDDGKATNGTGSVPNPSPRPKTTIISTDTVRPTGTSMPQPHPSNTQDQNPGNPSSSATGNQAVGTSSVILKSPSVKAHKHNRRHGGSVFFRE